MKFYHLYIHLQKHLFILQNTKDLDFPILEAMSLGCPVISSNTSSLPEVYGDAALNFTPTSSDELLNCITKITNNNELKEAYIKKGYNREKNFLGKKCAVETNKIYQKLI